MRHVQYTQSESIRPRLLTTQLDSRPVDPPTPEVMIKTCETTVTWTFLVLKTWPRSAQSRSVGWKFRPFDGFDRIDGIFNLPPLLYFLHIAICACMSSKSTSWITRGQGWRRWRIVSIRSNRRNFQPTIIIMFIAYYVAFSKCRAHWRPGWRLHMKQGKRVVPILEWRVYELTSG